MTISTDTAEVEKLAARFKNQFYLTVYEKDLAAATLRALVKERDDLRLKLQVAASVQSEVWPTWQCPNCGGWNHAREPRASSSTSSGTLYGVCKKCADLHTEFGNAWNRAALKE